MVSINQFASLDNSQILTDEMLSSIDGGACSESCKRACSTGNMNPTDVNTKPLEKICETIEKVADAAKNFK